MEIDCSREHAVTLILQMNFCYLLNLLALSYTPKYALYCAAYALLRTLHFAIKMFVSVHYVSWYYIYVMYAVLLQDPIKKILMNVDVTEEVCQ